MKLHIGICDDEKNQIEYLTKLVTAWADKSSIIVKIKSFCSAENYLFQYEDDKDFDILLLDIEMDKINGVELSKKIREENNDVQIIFVTGFADYIAEGYDVSALHYLMKPVSENKLCEVLNKAVSRIKMNDKSLFINVDGENVRLSFNDILYCESFAHNSVIATKTREYTVSLSFSELEKELDNTFIRCHRSYIANIRNIKSISKTDVILDNDKSVPLSRRLYNDVNQAFIKYFK